MDYFNLKQNNTTYRSEIMAGLSAFMSIAYILILNPVMLSQVGMDSYGVFVATALTIAITTGIAAFYTRLPMVYAPNIGLNCFFLFLVTKQFHGNWGIALLAVYLSGIGILLFTQCKICKRIMEAIPESIVHGLIVGMGLCLIKLGLVSCGVLTRVTSTYSIGQINTIECGYCLAALIIIALFLRLKRCYGLTFGFASVYILGIIIVFIKNYINTKESFFNYIIEILSHKLNSTRLTQVAFHFPPMEEMVQSGSQIIQLIIIVFLMMVVTLVTSNGTIGITVERLKEENDNCQKGCFTRCFQMNGIGNIISAGLGSAPIAVCPEYEVNREYGAKTGISSLTVSLAMLAAILMGPLFVVENKYLFAPVLICIGAIMITSVKLNHNASPIEKTLFVVITVYLGLTFELVNAILFGMSIYIIMKLLAGKREQLDHTMIFWIICSVIYLVLQV